MRLTCFRQAGSNLAVLTCTCFDITLQCSNDADTVPCHSYDGKIVVDRSVALGEPVIYVSMNYR